MKILMLILGVFSCSVANATAIDYEKENGEWVKFNLYDYEYDAWKPYARRSTNFYRDIITPYNDGINYKKELDKHATCKKQEDTSLTEADKMIPIYYRNKLEYLRKNKSMDLTYEDKTDLKEMCEYSSLYKECDSVTPEQVKDVLLDEGFFEERDARWIRSNKCVKVVKVKGKRYLRDTNLGAYMFYVLWDYNKEWEETLEEKYQEYRARNK